MSGLEFLLRKTLSNPSEIRKTSSPPDFKAALDEFMSFCEKQLPEIVETDFLPTCFDISENEETVIIGGKIGNIAVYDLQARKIVVDEEVSDSSLDTILFAMGDKKVIASTSTRELIILSMPELIKIKIFQLLPQPVSLKLGSSKGILYCSNYTDTLRVIDIDRDADEEFPERSIKTIDTICCIDVSDDGSLLALGLINGVIKLIHGESESELQSTPAHPSPPTIISFSEHRKHIGVGFKDFTLKVWLVDSNFSLKYEYKEHTAEITGIAFLKDNRYMVTGSRDTNIIMWDMKVERSPYYMKLIEKEVSWFKCSSDHKKLYFNQSSNCFMIWEVPQLTKNARYRKHLKTVNKIEFLPNSFELISVGSDGLAVIWDYRSDLLQDFKQLEGELTSVIASKNGKFVIITSSKNIIYTWNLSNDTIEDTECDAEIKSIKFSSDENKFAIGDRMNRIIIYDTEVVQKSLTIKGHMGPVSDLCFICNNLMLLSASYDRTIAKWDALTGNKLETFYGHRGPVRCLLVTPKGWVVSGSDNSEIIVWDISGIVLYTLTTPESGKIISLFLSENDEYMISLQLNKYHFWKMENLAVMFQCDTKFPASCLTMSHDEKIIAIAEGNTVFVEENPLKSPAIRLVGKDMGSQQNYMKFILDCIKNNNKGSLDEKHFHWVVSPYLISTSHILAYSNRVDELNLALFNRTNQSSFFSTVNNETPLSISVDLEYKNCIDICLKYMKHEHSKRKNKKAYVPLGDCLTKLNTIDLPEITRLYEILYQRAHDIHLPSFSFYETQLPVLYHSESLDIYPEKIVPKSMYSSNGRSISFHHSLCPLNIDIGTQDSIEFLESLTECSTDEVFRCTLLQVLLKNKWDRVKWAVYAQGSIYILYMVQLSIYCIAFLDSLVNLNLLFATHVLLFLYEFSQILTDPIDYWKDMWNILDQLRGLSCTIYAILMWQGYYDSDVLLTVIIFSWTRGISYFRMFDGTRYMVRLLSEVIKDMQVFFVILFYSTLAFSFIYLLRVNELSFSEYLVVSYRLDLGDFNADFTELFDWIIFFLATVINPLIMLNLLISIMGDTYSKVQESNDIANFQELTEMIIEIEKLMFWKKDKVGKHYLQICDFVSGTDASSDKIIEKIKTMRIQVSGIEDTVKYIKESIARKNIKETDEIISSIHADQDEIHGGVVEQLNQNNEILERILGKLETQNISLDKSKE